MTTFFFFPPLKFKLHFFFVFICCGILVKTANSPSPITSLHPPRSFFLENHSSITSELRLKIGGYLRVGFVPNPDSTRLHWIVNQRTRLQPRRWSVRFESGFSWVRVSFGWNQEGDGDRQISSKDFRSSSYLVGDHKILARFGQRVRDLHQNLPEILTRFGQRSQIVRSPPVISPNLGKILVETEDSNEIFEIFGWRVGRVSLYRVSDGVSVT